MLPGIIGMALMMSAISTTVSVNVKSGRRMIRKLATTPLSRLEWNVSKIISQTIIAVLSVVVSLAVAYAIFGLHPNIDLITVVFILVGT